MLNFFLVVLFDSAISLSWAIEDCKLNCKNQRSKEFMIELNASVPFLWRLGIESKDGYCSVAMVIPCPSDAEIEDLTIETNVLSLASDSDRAEQEETLEWNEDDTNLFLKLVNERKKQLGEKVSDSIKLDLSDPVIIDIIDIVAAAGFGVAFASHGLLISTEGCEPLGQIEVGEKVSLRTVLGFIPAVVVEIEDSDVVCVLLEELDIRTAGEALVGLDRVCMHDLLLVKRSDILSSEFAERISRPSGTPLH